LLGNIGLKSDEDEWYLGARGIRFSRHPGAEPVEEAGRWIVAASWSRRHASTAAISRRSSRSGCLAIAAT
jgi:hypothetical protein